MQVALRTKLLLIEHNPKDAQHLSSLLASAETISFEITAITSLKDLDPLLATQHFEIILLDLNLPDTQGLEAVVHTHIAAPELPIIVLSDHEEESQALTVVQAGAQDYLVKKNLDARNLIRSIRYAMERNRLTVTLNEVNKQQQHLATHDLLTGLPNRQLLNDRLGQTLLQSQRYKRLFAVLFIDLDGFKTINDSLGHDYGDELLQMVSERLKNCIRTADTLGRLGGDEFIILLTELHQINALTNIGNNILDVFLKPFVLRGHELYVTTSIGIAIYPHDGADIKTLLKNADAAMYVAKAHGRNNFAFYTPELQRSSYKQLTLLNNLRHALVKHEFLVYFQPQLDVSTNQIRGMETLLRWHHPKLGFIQPQDFIHVAEEAGVIVSIGEWILSAAFKQYLAWKAEGCAPPFIAVNVSLRQFEQPGFIEMVKKIATELEFNLKHLDLEVTESIIMRNPTAVILQLQELKKLGVHISIDDFGTGHSSLSYLKDLPIDSLKIDKSFVTGLSQDGNNSKIIQAVILLAHGLGLKVLAEGVETEEEKDLLLSHGCTQMQGYLFCKPLSTQDAMKFLKKT